MKRIILLLSISFLFFSCSYEWPPPYVNFEEATAHITEQYGEPAVIRDTAFYDDGTVRNRVVYWDIDPPETEIFTTDYGQVVTREYITYYIEIWNQPYSNRSTVIRYRQYGWEILRESRTLYQYVE